MFDTAKMISFGRFLLEKVPPEPSEHPAKWLKRIATWPKENADHPFASMLDKLLTNAPLQVGWALAWTISGFQRVQVGHRLAASLMASEPDEESDVRDHAPWAAFTIEIPPEVARINVNGKIIPLDVIGVWHHGPSSMSCICVWSRAELYSMTTRLTFPLPRFGPNVLEEDDRTSAERALGLLAHLVVCTQVEITDREHVKVPVLVRGAREDSTAPSGIHRLTRVVKIDCRDDIASFIAGTRRKSQGVLTLVCGHYKNVAHGPRHSLRRRQYIEPAWRGPRDAEIAVRPHRIVDDE